MNKIEFLREGLKNLKTVGTVAPSSKYLCQGMLRSVDFSKANTIVELGPGDGVITEYILRAMRPEAKLFSFEVNEAFCELLQTKIIDSRFHLVQDSAVYMEKYLTENQQEKADYIISALPFSMLPEALMMEVLQESKKVLRPGGLFIQYHYSLFLKKIYQEVFKNVAIDFVALNIPPAFVFKCS